MKHFQFQFAWSNSPVTPPYHDQQGWRSVFSGSQFKLNAWSPLEYAPNNHPSSQIWTYFIGNAVVRSLGKNQPDDLSVYCTRQLDAGQTICGLLQDLEGSFAFISWDPTSNALSFAIDKVGNRNLYYAREGNILYCADHLRWICEMTQSKELDVESLHLYLGLKGIPAPHTPVAGIKKAVPGRITSFHPNGLSEETYWNPLANAGGEYSGSINEAAICLSEKLSQSIELFSSSHPLTTVGVFLSGGLDSAMLAALAHRRGIPLKAFTAGYAPAYRTDETQYAALVAKQLGIVHQVCRLDSAQIPALIQTNCKDLPEPVADPSFWPQINLAHHMIGQVNGVLDGTGADSLLGGSNKYAVKRYSDLYRKIPQYLRKNLITPISALLPGSRRLKLTNWFRLWQVFIRGSELSEQDQLIYYSRFFQVEDVSTLLKNSWRHDCDLSRELLNHFHLEVDPARSVAAAGYMTFKAVQPWVELLKLNSIERNTGLSVYKPFLFSPVIEFNLSLPDSFKVKDGQRKFVQHRACEGLVPAEILHRPKANFSPPVGRWLRDLRQTVMDSVIQPDSPFDSKTILRWYKQQENGWRDWQSELWAIYMWQTWWNEL